METRNRVEIENGERRTKLENLTEKAKQVRQRLQDQTVAGAKATDKAIRKNPYQAAGIAFGVGVLVGFLVRWSRRDSEPAAEYLRPGPGD
jgi:ElaB/YqjD/DUF883 family membrane-anchored ribosome-binding protein